LCRTISCGIFFKKRRDKSYPQKFQKSKKRFVILKLIDRSGRNPINYKKIIPMPAKKKPAKKAAKKVAKKKPAKKARA
jgi:hypothetical protein